MVLSLRCHLCKKRAGQYDRQTAESLGAELCRQIRPENLGTSAKVYIKIEDANVGLNRPRCAAERHIEETLLDLRETLEKVVVADPLRDYAVRLVLSTHPDNELAPEGVRQFVRWGASPRAAQALIRAGIVFVNDRRLDKPGTSIAEDADVEVRGKPHPWVSRGGVKLAYGLDQFDLDPNGLICLDVGASTGGFTDVLLTRGAARVYAVDVGRGQLDWRLRQDGRVVVLEGINARYLTSEHVPEEIEFVVCDASFIGLQIVLPAALSLAMPGAVLVALIKPQFEVGRTEVGKGGIVRDEAARHGALEKVVTILERYRLDGVSWIDSPIQGAKGNREFLIYGKLP